MDLKVLKCGNCEELKLGIHATALGLAALCGLYNAAAWLSRREQHLALNAVMYAALIGIEQRHVAHHVAELRHSGSAADRGEARWCATPESGGRDCGLTPPHAAGWLWACAAAMRSRIGGWLWNSHCTSRDGSLLGEVLRPRRRIAEMNAAGLRVRSSAKPVGAPLECARHRVRGRHHHDRDGARPRAAAAAGPATSSTP